MKIAEGIDPNDFFEQAKLGAKAAEDAEKEFPLDSRTAELQSAVKRLRDANTEVAAAEQHLSQILDKLVEQR